MRHTSALALAQFEQHLYSRNFSKRTVKDYTRLTGKYLEFLERENLEFKETSIADIRSFHYELMQKKIKDRPLHIGTIRKHLDAVKCFYRFLHATGKLYFDPMASYELPKRPKNLPRHIMEEEEVVKLLEAPESSTTIGLRDRAILELMYSTGLRNKEIRRLELKDIDIKGRTLRTIGKGNKEAVLPFGVYAQKALQSYLLESRPKLLNGKNGGPKKKHLKEGDFVFISANGHPLMHTALTYMVAKYRKKADIEKPITPHSIRHSVATHLLKAGADIRYIQRLLRHASLDTTQIYTRVEVTDLREVQKKYHPRERAL